MTTDKFASGVRFRKELGPQELLDFYDEWVTVGNYDEMVLAAGYRGPVAVASHMNQIFQDKDLKILDIGAGSGMVGEQLAKYGFSNVYAVEPSKESLDICRRNGFYKEFVESFVGPTPLPFDDNSFAGAVSSAVFFTGHCDGTSLREVVRLVKPGGSIVIATSKTFFDDHHDNFNLRAVSDELVSAKVCYMVQEDIPNYSEQKTGIVLIYTVL